MTNGRVEFQNGAPGQTQRRIHRPIGHTLDSTYTWTAEIDFHPTTVGLYGGQPFTGHYPLAVTAGIEDFRFDCPTLPCPGFPRGKQDGINVFYSANNPPDGNLYFHFYIKDSLDFFKSPVSITANDLDTTYYLRLERLADTLVRLGVYWDDDRTVHLNGSSIQYTIPATVTGLTTVQTGVETAGDIRRELYGWSDNLCLNWEKMSVGNAPIAKKPSISLYPNPAFDLLYVQYDEPVSIRIRIFDYTGKLWKEAVLDANRRPVDVAGLSAGIYFAEVQIGNISHYVRFLKK
ncbi:MAG: T9SS type A sorting domain-containing protein [Bacteroidia bacterium]